MVIREIAGLLPKFAEDIEILNVGKLISFRIGEEKYEIDLKQKRKPKETAKKQRFPDNFQTIWRFWAVFTRKLPLFCAFFLLDNNIIMCYNYRGVADGDAPNPHPRTLYAFFSQMFEIYFHFPSFPEYPSPMYNMAAPAACLIF